MNYEEIQKENLRKEIVEMVQQITDEKFLKRIFVSLREYLKESKPD